MAAFDTLRRAGELLSSYVTYGAWRDDSQFDATFAEIAALLPAALRAPPARAWRVVTVSDAEVAHLRGGGVVTLRPRAYGSWTKARDAVPKLLRGRVATLATGRQALVIAKDIDSALGVVDVEALYRRLGWTEGSGVEEWALYVSWEAEIVLAQTPALLAIHPDDVVAIHPPGDLTALRPLPGESFWLPAADDFGAIAAVADDQPHAAKGVWLIEDGGGARRAVFWNSRPRDWEETEAPPGAP